MTPLVENITHVLHDFRRGAVYQPAGHEYYDLTGDALDIMFTGLRFQVSGTHQRGNGSIAPDFVSECKRKRHRIGIFAQLKALLNFDTARPIDLTFPAYLPQKG